MINWVISAHYGNSILVWDATSQTFCHVSDVTSLLDSFFFADVLKYLH